MWKLLKMINTCLISASSHPPQWGQQCCPRCHTAPPSPLLSSGHFYTYALDLSEWPVPFYETCSRSDLESTTDNLRLSKQLKKVKPREQKSLAGAGERENGMVRPAPLQNSAEIFIVIEGRPWLVGKNGFAQGGERWVQDLGGEGWVQIRTVLSVRKQTMSLLFVGWLASAHQLKIIWINHAHTTANKNWHWHQSSHLFGFSKIVFFSPQKWLGG